MPKDIGCLEMRRKNDRTLSSKARLRWLLYRLHVPIPTVLVSAAVVICRAITVSTLSLLSLPDSLKCFRIPKIVSFETKDVGGKWRVNRLGRRVRSQIVYRTNISRPLPGQQQAYPT